MKMSESSEEIEPNHPYLQFLSRDPEIQNRWLSAHDWDHLVSDEMKIAKEISRQLVGSDLVGFVSVFQIDFVQDLIAAEAAWADHECEHAIPVMAELLEYVIAGIASIGDIDLEDEL